MTRENSSATSPSSRRSLVQPPTNIQDPKTQALLARIALAKEHTYGLQQLWLALAIDASVPSSRQFMIWFGRHEFDTITYAFSVVATWLNKLGDEDESKFFDDKIKYASGVMNRRDALDE